MGEIARAGSDSIRLATPIEGFKKSFGLTEFGYLAFQFYPTFSGGGTNRQFRFQEAKVLFVVSEEGLRRSGTFVVKSLSRHGILELSRIHRSNGLAALSR